MPSLAEIEARFVGGPDQRWGATVLLGPSWPSGGSRDLVEDTLEALEQARFRGWAVGVDTETINCNPKSTGPDGNPWLAAHPVVMSLGIPGTERGSKGQRLCHRVLVHESFFGAFKPWLESEAPKALHHEDYDSSAFHNVGIKLAGVVADTMERVRVAKPGSRRSLKVRMIVDLAYQPVGEYEETFSVPVFTTKTVLEHFRCPHERGWKLDPAAVVAFKRTADRPHQDCHDQKCAISGRHGTGYWHKVKRSVEVETKRTQLIPLQQLCDPAHPLFPTFVDYATLDAKATGELASLPWGETYPMGSLKIPQEWA